MKKFLTLLLVLSFTFFTFPINSLNVNADYEGNLNDFTIETIDGKNYLVDEDGAQHIFYTSDGQELSPEEALSALNQQNDYETLRGPVNPFADTIAVGSSNQVLGNRYKITPDMKGPCQIGTGQTITVSESFSGDFNITGSFKVRLLGEIKAQAGFQWVSSTTTSSYFDATYEVPANKVGAIYFTPYFRKFNITYCDTEGVNHKIVAKSPIETYAGFADGLYELVLK